MIKNVLKRTINELIDSGGEPWEYDSQDIQKLVNWIEVKQKKGQEDRANEKLRASALHLLNALTAITDNIDVWLESGEPADKETSKKLYDNAKIAINKALL